MKLVHIITTIDRGGAEKQLLILARQQVNAGKEISVIYLKGKAELEKSFRAAGVEIVGQFSNKSLFRQVLQIKKFLNKHNFDLIHAHLPRAEILTALIRNERTFLISRHNAEPFWPQHKYFGVLLSQYIARKSKFIIAITESVKCYCHKSREIPRKKNIEVIHYGVDTVNNSIRAQSFKEIDMEPLVIGTIARLVPQKDLPTLLRGFAMYNSNFPKSELRIIGSGYLEIHLKTLAKKLGISNKVSWIPNTDSVDVEYSKLDVFVLSSRYEGFGLVFLEAMSHGLPILAADNSAAKEVLGQNCGFLFKIGDYHQLSTLLSEVSSPEMREKLRAQSIDRLRLFDSKVMETKLSNLLERI